MGDAIPPNTLGTLARELGAELQGGDTTTPVAGCATLDQAGPQDVSFLTNTRYIKAAGESAAAAIICGPKEAELLTGRTLLIADEAYFAFRQAMVLLHGWRPTPSPSVHPMAAVDPAATIGTDVYIGPHCIVEAGATVGDRSVLYGNVYVGRNATVGTDAQLFAGVCVYDGCRLGARVTLHAGCSIGHDGFGYATAPADASSSDPKQPPVHHKIPQAGIAVIEDDVEMGANCSVDRATLGATTIGRGTKFSNNVVIGHGCTIGPHNLYVAHVGVAGSVITGSYVVLGGQVGVAGHLTIGDQVQVAGSSKVVNDLAAGGKYGGTPAVELTLGKRIVLQQQRLPDLAARIKKLERELAKLNA